MAFSASTAFLASGEIPTLTDAKIFAYARYSAWVQRSNGCLWHWAHSTRTPRNAAAVRSPQISIGTACWRRQYRSSVSRLAYSEVSNLPTDSIPASTFLTCPIHSSGDLPSRLVAV